MKKIPVVLCALMTTSLLFGQGPLIPYRDGKKWGYSDTMGKIVIAPKYDRADLFNYWETVSKPLRPVSTVVADNGLLAIDEKGNVLVPGNYESIEFSYTRKDIFFIVENSKAKKGLYVNGKELIPCIYDEITPYPNDSYKLEKNRKVGLVNSQGKLILPVEYDEIDPNEKTSGDIYIWSTKKGKIVQIFPDSRISPAIPTGTVIDDTAVDYISISNKAEEEAGNLKRNYDADSTVIKGNMIFVYKKNKVAIKIIDKEDRMPAIFAEDIWVQDAEYIVGNTFDQAKFHSKTLIIARNKAGKVGIITESASPVLPFEYTDIFVNGSYLILYKGSTKGFMLLDTPYPFIPAVYDKFHDYHAIRVNDNWNFGLFLIEKNGKEGYVGENGVEFFKN